MANVIDNPTRTSTTSPGTATSGQVWRAEIGTWGTNGQSLYSVTKVDNDQVTIEMETAQQDVSAVLNSTMNSSTFPGLMFRWASTTSNYWVEPQLDGSLEVYRNQNGLTLLNKTGTGLYTTGKVLRALATDDGTTLTIKTYVDGVLAQTITDTTSGRPSGTRAGFRHGAGTTNQDIRWDTIRFNMVTSGRTDSLIGYSAASITAPTSSGTAPTTLIRGYRASTLSLSNGAAVPTWAPYSGSESLAQGTAANQPVYASSVSAFGNKPGVTFNSSDFLQATTSATNQPVTLVLVVSTNVDGDEQAIHHGSELLMTAQKWVGYSGNGGLTSSVLASGPQVVTYVANGASSAIYVNGTLRASGTSGTTGLNTVLRMGLHTDGSRQFLRTIAEYREYGSALTAAERSSVHSEMQNAYGIAVSDYSTSATGGMKQRRGGVWSTAKYKKNGVWTTGPKIRKNGTWN